MSQVCTQFINMQRLGVWRWEAGDALCPGSTIQRKAPRCLPFSLLIFRLPVCSSRADPLSFLPRYLKSEGCINQPK